MNLHVHPLPHHYHYYQYSKFDDNVHHCWNSVLHLPPPPPPLLLLFQLHEKFHLVSYQLQVHHYPPLRIIW